MRRISFTLLLLAQMPAPLMAQAPCRLCLPAPAGAQAAPETDVPLRIEIETALDFSRAALNGSSGEIAIDPQTGMRRVGGSLVDLGGMPVRGTVRISGGALRPVRVSMPHRVELRSSTGATAEVTGLVTDLSPAPRLGNDGRLSFSFGGRLVVRGAASGVFRGAIPITADYQ